MSGRRLWSELTKQSTPEQTRYIKENKGEATAETGRERHSEIHIPPIKLEWSYWHSWRDVERDARQDGVVVPNKEPGVYEVMLDDGRKTLLALGRTNDLRMQIKQGLVRGKAPHSVGDRIRADMKEGKIRASDIGIRWAVTDRPAAVAEELHKRYKAWFGELPKYNKRG